MASSITCPCFIHIYIIGQYDANDIPYMVNIVKLFRTDSVV